MIVVKSPDEVDRMRASGRVAAATLDAVVRRVSPGVTTRDLDAYAAEIMRGHGARSAFYGYRGFPGQICVSLNEAVVHGIPDGRRIRLGDVVSVDVGVVVDGFIGDTARTILVGVTDPGVIRLARTAESALAAGIEAARPGNRVSDISYAIESVATGMGFSVVREFVGHGVGRKMHEDPQVPNFGPPGKGAKLRPGMTLALEPMLNMGVGEVEILADGWTVLTADRKPSVHCEHTIVIQEGPAEILTVRPGGENG